MHNRFIIMQEYLDNPTENNLSKLLVSTEDKYNTLTKLIQFSQIYDRKTYGRILLCLHRYKKEYNDIFCYSTHENGGYFSPPDCFVEFGEFYENIQNILTLNSVNITPNEFNTIIHEYSLEPKHNNLTTELFDWTQPYKVIDNLTTVNKK